MHVMGLNGMEADDEGRDHDYDEKTRKRKIKVSVEWSNGLKSFLNFGQLIT